MCAVMVVVQSEFTVHDPLMVSLAKPPPTFLASVPETFPAASTLILPTAAPGTGPVGRIRVPVRVNPHFPAAVAVEQLPLSSPYAAVARPMHSVTTEIITNVVLAMLRFMRVLPNCNFEAEVRIAKPTPSSEKCGPCQFQPTPMR